MRILFVIVHVMFAHIMVLHALVVHVLVLHVWFLRFPKVLLSTREADCMHMHTSAP